MKSYGLALLVVVITATGVTAQPHHHHTRTLTIPDTNEYLSLLCDLHMHTVFSDGSVWPDIRVQEAIGEGLDCIAVTEHLEYLPHRDDIPLPDRNRPFNVAREMVDDSTLIVIPGSEITRRMPPGHSNAIFVRDANKLLIEDSLEVFVEAGRQESFVFWNHPNWTPHQPDGRAQLRPIHKTLLDRGLLHGIEVVNDITYSDEALQIALDNNLTIIGTSDVHGLVDWQFGVGQGGHRPLTVVFATERSLAGIREALFAGRTAVWFEEILIGRPEYVLPLVRASVEIEEAKYWDNSTVLEVTFVNKSDIQLSLINKSGYGLHNSSDLVVLPPQSKTDVLVKTVDELEWVKLAFELANVVVAPDTHPTYAFEADVTPRDSPSRE